jgi:hypothetical protein
LVNPISIIFSIENVIFVERYVASWQKGGHFVYLPQILSFHKRKAYESEREKERILSPPPQVFFWGQIFDI